MRVVDIITQKLKEHSLSEIRKMNDTQDVVLVFEKKTAMLDSGTESDNEVENSDPEAGEIRAILDQDSGFDSLVQPVPYENSNLKRPLQQSNLPASSSSFRPVTARRHLQNSDLGSPVSDSSSPCTNTSDLDHCCFDLDFDRNSSEEELADINFVSSSQQRITVPSVREKRTWDQANSDMNGGLEEPVMFSSSPPKDIARSTRTLSPRIFLSRVAPSTCISSYVSPSKRHRQSVLDDVSSSVRGIQRPFLDFEKMQKQQVHCC